MNSKDLDFRIRDSEAGRRLLFSVRTRSLLLRATLVLCITASVLFFLLLFLENEFWGFLYLPMPLPVLGGAALLQLLRYVIVPRTRPLVDAPFCSAFELKFISGLVDLVLVFAQLGAGMYSNVIRDVHNETQQ